MDTLNNSDNNHDQQGLPKKSKGLSPRNIASTALLLLGIGLLWLSMRTSTPPSPEASSVQPIPLPSSESSEVASTITYDEKFLEGKLYITEKRAAYKSGQMVLKIPRMGVDSAIEAGVGNEHLDIGPGLFDYSQLPGESKHNVSIGAHRDIKGSHFYFIHKLTSGDLFYLVYDDNIYVYEYKDTKVIKPSDWGPIYGQGFECLTLISCTPIGTTRDRIVVRAELKQTLPYTNDYTYLPWSGTEEKPYAWESKAKSWDDQ